MTKEREREFAEAGARLRIAQLEAELVEIQDFMARGLRAQAAVDEVIGHATADDRPRARRSMTAAQRADVSRRMKRYWRERRRAGG